MFPVSNRLIELILVPELLEQGAALVRVTMTKEDFLARLRIVGQLNFFTVLATLG